MSLRINSDGPVSPELRKSLEELFARAYEQECNKMTMPHLMNCPHTESGWCLDCVNELHSDNQALSTALVGAYVNYDVSPYQLATDEHDELVTATVVAHDSDQSELCYRMTEDSVRDITRLRQNTDPGA